MTDTGEDDTWTAELSTMDQAQEILTRLPARRWRALQVRFDRNIQELMRDPVDGLIVLAHEHWRVTTQQAGGPVRDDWDRFEDMSLRELNAYLDTGAADKSTPVPGL